MLAGLALGGCSDLEPERITGPAATSGAMNSADDFDFQLRGYLASLGFTGRIASTLHMRLGRRIDQQLADAGRLLWFDPIQGLNDDNTCAGCHSPTNGFGDTQPIAIGVERTALWGRAGSGRETGAEVVRRLNSTDNYRQLFARVVSHVKAGAPITFDDFARAIAEFEFTLVFANAPIDRYARGVRNALTPSQKKGAVLFFGRAGCVSCHAVSGPSNEMFSDFRQHVAGVPQIAPSFTNMVFDGPGANEDFGLEQVTGDRADRYAFRTSPLRNVALQPAFMHNGAFVGLEDAIRYHLDAVGGAATYSTVLFPADLQGTTGPTQPVLDRLDPLLRTRVQLTKDEFDSLVDFVRNGLLDPDARPKRLRRLILGSAYSTRIATIGSTRSARRVGTTQASRHTPSMNAA